MKSNGFISYITPNTYLSLKNYEDLRKIIFEKSECHKIIDLGFDVFDEPVVPSAIFIVRKNNNEAKQNKIYYADLKVFNNKYLKSKVNTKTLKRVEFVTHVDSEYVNVMQLSDLVSGALKDYFTGKNKELKNLIKKKYLYKVF